MFALDGFVCISSAHMFILDGFVFIFSAHMYISSALYIYIYRYVSYSSPYLYVDAG